MIDHAITALFGVALMALLFAGLVIRHAWAWLTRETWGNVIVSVERKALK